MSVNISANVLWLITFLPYCETESLLLGLISIYKRIPKLHGITPLSFVRKPQIFSLIVIVETENKIMNTNISGYIQIGLCKLGRCNRGVWK